MATSNLLILIAVQAIWASSYIAMKIGLETLTPEMVSFLRYFFVLVCFIPFWFANGFPKIDARILLASFVVGVANFYGSPLLQVHSLKYTQATDVSFLILIEPMITVLMAFLILKEKVTRNLWKVLLLSMIGFFLISDISFARNQATVTKLRFFGNMLFFGSIFFEALCSVTGKYFTKKNKPWNAMGLLMAMGVVFSFLMNSSEIISYDYAAVPGRTWGAILFLSLGCSIFSYCAWYYVIEKVPVQYVALSLFLQPVIASVLGYLILNESLTIKTTAGGAVIVLALLWFQRLEKATKAQLHTKLEVDLTQPV